MTFTETGDGEVGMRCAGGGWNLRLPFSSPIIRLLIPHSTPAAINAGDKTAASCLLGETVTGPVANVRPSRAYIICVCVRVSSASLAKSVKWTAHCGPAMCTSRLRPSDMTSDSLCRINDQTAARSRRFVHAAQRALSSLSYPSLCTGARWR